MASTSTYLSIKSVNNEINGDVNGAVSVNYNRSHKNIIDDKATKLDACTN